MRTIRLFMVALLLSVSSVLCQAIPQKPDQERLVNDFAGIFTNAQIAALESELVAFDDSTSNQILVVTIADLESDTINSFAYRIGESWGVGSNGFNNGLVLLVKPKTDDEPGQVTIQVGYGLEGAIPDAYCKRIINYYLIPKFREGDYYGGVVDACHELEALASGEISEPRKGGEIEDVSEILLRLFLFFLIMFILIKIMNRRNHGGGGGWNGGSGDDFGRHIYIGPIGGWGNSWGGGSFGGGGSIGGFGGFGGGHFGGGGASGSW